MRFAFLAASLLLFVLPSPSSAQAAKPKHPQDLKGFTVPDEPVNPQPAASTFRDPKYRVSFHVPAGWDTEHKDGILSNFGKDVRSTHSNMDVRGVVAINYNPYPATTFSGALLYYSAVPRSNVLACAALATTGHLKPMPDVKINGMDFKHGQDQHGGICTESRNEVFTTLRGKSCLRFDFVVNTFCPQSSGAMEMNAQQLGDIDGRLGKMLGSLHIDP